MLSSYFHMPDSEMSPGAFSAWEDSFFFESSPDCVKLLDREGRLVGMNKNGQCAMEIANFELVRGRPWPDMWPPESQGRVAESLEAARNGMGSRFEAFCPGARGTPKWWDVTVAPLKGQAGLGEAILSISRDITELHHAREAERATAGRLRFVLEAARVGEWELDLVSGQATTSLLHDRCFGYDQPYAGWTLDVALAHMHPEDRDEVARAFASAQEGRTKLHFQCRVVWKDGSIHWISAFGNFYPAGALARRLVGTVQEITEQVQAQLRLRDSEARFRTMAEASPQLIWSTDANGQHDYYNQRWYEFTGESESASGERRVGIVHPHDEEEARTRWRHSLATGDKFEMEYRLRHSSGAYRWILARALPVRDEAGRISRWMGSCTDIHEQMTAQQALERSEESLREANRRKDEFLAMLAHELRNPLAPIGTAAELLRRSMDHPKRVEQASLIISRQVQHMTDLVNDLLDVSRVTRGQIQLNTETLDLKEVVREAMEQVRPLVEKRSHLLTTRLPSAPMWVLGDRTRLIQVMSNLLNNAAKYTPLGGQVVVEGTLAAGRALLQVRDNGEGIHENLLPHIFELFTQAQRSPDRAQGGLGIGLALVKSLVTLHDGEITAESAGKDEGSTFTVSLPCAPGRPAAAVAPAVTIPQGTRRVVVVDDNTDAAETLGSLLESVGHQVSIFSTGEALLGALPGLQADTFILDIGLPGITGHEIGRRLRGDARFEHASIFALSGYGQEDDQASSAASGFDRHFVKPLDPGVLLGLLSDSARA